MKLQPGDYVSTEGMTEEEYHAVCRAFIEAGADKGESAEGIEEMKGWAYIGWVTPDRTDSTWCSSGIFCFDDHSSDTYFKRNRQLTKDQILGAQKMTKVTVFGQEEAKKEEKKAIELVYLLDVHEGREKTSLAAEDWGNVCLLGKADTGGEDYDLIMAWDNNSNKKCIFLGHWNDGVVE